MKTKPTLVFLRGLPASGKSTFAQTLVEQGFTRVNKDDLRAMLHNSKWSRGNEKQVLAIRDAIITDALERGRSVVVDDTNLAPKHETALRQMAEDYGVEFKIEDFTHVPLEECLKRDSNRQNPVGRSVILRMYNDFLRPVVEPYSAPEAPLGLICDIDNTLAHATDRGVYDFSKAGEDAVDLVVLDIVQRYADDRTILLVTGREEKFREITVGWLKRHDIPWDFLFMRSTGDHRKDYVVKKEIFDEHIRGKWDVPFVLDDRVQTVRGWREMGLKVLQVAEGEF